MGASDGSWACSVFRGKILSLAREGLLIEGERHAHVIHHIHAAFLEESCPLQASGSIH